MTLFDIVSEEEKEDFDVKLPDVGEYTKETMLAFEKEVLGIYVSGHPLEEYEALWRKNISVTTMDFVLDEETQQTRVKDGENVIIGGMIADKKIKYTKNDKVMAFLTIEDLLGTVEVIVFPKDYEKNSAKLVEDNKVFISGRVSVEEDRDGKLVCEKITAFDEIPRKLWVKFPTKEIYDTRCGELFEVINDSEGKDQVVIYIEENKMIKNLPANRNVNANRDLISRLSLLFGEDNIKIV